MPPDLQQPALASNNPGLSLRRVGLLGSLVALDQSSKALVEATLAFGEVLPVAPSFNLVHVLNPGAAFSFLADAGGWQRYFFFVLALLVSGWLMASLRKAEGASRLYTASALLISSGALGNAIDRLARGAVVDFLDVYWGPHHWPAFNLADSFIMVGVSLLLWFEVRRGKA